MPKRKSVHGIYLVPRTKHEALRLFSYRGLCTKVTEEEAARKVEEFDDQLESFFEKLVIEPLLIFVGKEKKSANFLDEIGE